MLPLIQQPAGPGDPAARPRRAKVIDQARCIGCHACTTACKSENDVPVGVTRTYTAFLFAQAKARDLWQSPLLPPHVVVQAVVAGAAALLVLAGWLEAGATPTVAWVLAAAAATHLLLVLGEVSLPHGTAHARTATAGSRRTPAPLTEHAPVLDAADLVELPWRDPLAHGLNLGLARRRLQRS